MAASGTQICFESFKKCLTFLERSQAASPRQADFWKVARYSPAGQRAGAAGGLRQHRQSGRRRAAHNTGRGMAARQLSSG